MMLPRKRQRPNPAISSSPSVASPAAAAPQQQLSTSQPGPTSDPPSQDQRQQQHMPPTSQTNGRPSGQSGNIPVKQVNIRQPCKIFFLSFDAETDLGRFAKHRVGTDCCRALPRHRPLHQSHERTSLGVVFARKRPPISAVSTLRRTARRVAFAALRRAPRGLREYRKVNRTAPIWLQGETRMERRIGKRTASIIREKQKGQDLKMSPSRSRRRSMLRIRQRLKSPRTSPLNGQLLLQAG